jgi:hypothetical protein
LEGERLIQDNKENIAGKFLENHLDTNNSYIISVAQNAYPAGVNSDIIEEDMSIISNKSRFQTLDFVIYSPKFKLRNMYFNIALARNLEESVMYSSKGIEIISIWGNRE